MSTGAAGVMKLAFQHGKNIFQCQDRPLDSRKFKNTLLNPIFLPVKYQILFKNEIPHFKQSYTDA